ncbi:MAG: OmpA family protein, partial [Flavobacteriaceae bacterium]
GVNNGNKFTSPIKSIAIAETTNSQSTSALTSTLTSNSTSKAFEKTQIVDNFKFEITGLSKAGEMLTMDYKITNLAADDRKLQTCANMIYFYDDLGNLNFPYQVCLANSCSLMPSWIKSPSVPEKYHCNSSINSTNLMPSGIPINGKIIVRGINKRATKFVRGTVWFNSEVSYQLNYSNMEFPKVVDPNNSNKRNFGNQSLELVETVRDSISTYVRFKHTNSDLETYTSQIKTGELYDDMGNKHGLDAMSMISNDKRINYNRFNGWKLVINPKSTSDMYAIIDNIAPSASQIRRITLTFNGFTLSWDNIDIQGAGRKQPSTEYMPYADFEQKVRNKQNVLGTKVILKNIHFNTGSDVILKDSYEQLNQLADLLNLNNNLKVEVSGHTDNVGEDISNMLLSQKRADAIKYYLIGKSVPPTKVFSIGKGENEPIGTNTTEAGKQENRRVEILVVE